jgi:CheY-like chemotaxis protein/HPt (histidine-containing phosphotransfer) domain-containing protein
MNVIGNSVKFTRDGRITIEAQVLDHGSATPQLQINVSDTGIGMDKALQVQIFDDFMTGDSSYDRDVGGTGLGLGVARRFVKALGGEIEVESEPGVGSTFGIRFPVETMEPPQTHSGSRKTSASASPKHILLVEDNEINRVVAREMLIAAGHRVTEATNGKRAVELAGSEPFDLIFMDISMPVMDGRQATREIRAGQGAGAQTPIVALTANAMAEEQEAFLSDGMNDILTKPLTRDGLLRVIAKHTEARAEVAVPDTDQSNAVAHAYLEELRATLGNDALGTLLNRFVTEMDDTLAFLQNSSRQTLADIAARAHRIAGSAATLGAVELRTGLLRVEEAAKSGDARALANAIDALPVIWTATRPQIRTHRRTTER